MSWGVIEFQVKNESKFYQPTNECRKMSQNYSISFRSKKLEFLRSSVSRESSFVADDKEWLCHFIHHWGTVIIGAIKAGVNFYNKRKNIFTQKENAFSLPLFKFTERRKKQNLLQCSPIDTNRIRHCFDQYGHRTMISEYHLYIAT